MGFLSNAGSTAARKVTAQEDKNKGKFKKNKKANINDINRTERRTTDTLQQGEDQNIAEREKARQELIAAQERAIEEYRASQAAAQAANTQGYQQARTDVAAGTDAINQNYDQARGDIQTGYATGQQQLTQGYDAGRTALTQGYDQAESAVGQGETTARGDITYGRDQAMGELNTGEDRAIGYLDSGDALAYGYIDDAQAGGLAALERGATDALGYLDQGEARSIGAIDDATAQALGYYEPYVGYGEDAAAELAARQGLVGNTPEERAANQAAAMERFKTSPDYEFRRREALSSMDTHQNASTGRYRGSALKALQDRAADLASEEYAANDARLASTRALGYDASSASAGVASDAGKSRAQIYDTGGARRADVATGLGRDSASVYDASGRYRTDVATTGAANRANVAGTMAGQRADVLTDSGNRLADVALHSSDLRAQLGQDRGRDVAGLETDLGQRRADMSTTEGNNLAEVGVRKGDALNSNALANAGLAENYGNNQAEIITHGGDKVGGTITDMGKRQADNREGTGAVHTTTSQDLARTLLASSGARVDARNLATQQITNANSNIGNAQAAGVIADQNEKNALISSGLQLAGTALGGLGGNPLSLAGLGSKVGGLFGSGKTGVASSSYGGLYGTTY